MRAQCVKFVIPLFLLAVLLLQAATADARAIRVDDGEGAWTEPSPSSNVVSLQIDLGFEFNFFGETFTSVIIDPNGSVRFSDSAFIAPFLDATQTLAYSFSTTTAALADGILDGFRVLWGDDESANQFQLAIFNFGSGNFGIEFNYAGITQGSDATSSIGYNNGAGTEVDLLDILGTLLGDPLTFVEYEGVGANGLDSELCESAGTILACNNYSSISGLFGPGTNLLPGGFDGFFLTDPSFGVPVQGRYFFLVGEVVVDPSPVPEPGAFGLFAIGLAGLALRRRRRA